MCKHDARKSIILLIVSSFIVGCNSSYLVRRELYDTGQPRLDDWSVLDVNPSRPPIPGRESEFYPDGRLKSETWTVSGRPEVKLTFHENGRLKSEERFNGDRLEFAAYYDADGALAQTVGHRFGKEISPPSVTRSQAIKIARRAINEESRPKASSADVDPTMVALIPGDHEIPTWYVSWKEIGHAQIDAKTGGVNRLRLY
jgi:hypothetical protein